MDKINAFIETNEESNSDEDGCDEGFEASSEINENVVSGFFLDEVFVYMNNKNKINYAIEDKTFNITTLDSNYFLLGYLQSFNKIYLMNKNFSLISYTFPLSFVNYQMAILKKQFEQAGKVIFVELLKQILSTVPSEYLDKVTKFLEKFDYYDLSYEITTNPIQKYI